MKKAKLSLLAMLVLSLFCSSGVHVVFIGQRDVVEKTIDIFEFEEILLESSYTIYNSHVVRVKILLVNE